MACGAWTGCVDAIVGAATATSTASSSMINRLRLNRMETNCGRTSEASVASEWESNLVGALSDRFSAISCVVHPLFSLLAFVFSFYDVWPSLSLCPSLPPSHTTDESRPSTPHQTAHPTAPAKPICSGPRTVLDEFLLAHTIPRTSLACT